MGRLSIELPDGQHKQIKALAALHGVSIKDYILQKTLSGQSGSAGELDQLKSFLASRIEAARRKRTAPLSIERIIKKAKAAPKG